MGEPITPAGRALLAEMHPCDGPDNGHSTPGGTWHMSSNRMGSMLDAVASQARADLLDRLAAGVRDLADEMDESDVMTGPGMGEFADRLRALIEEARNGG